jgi:hypothetical protein
MKASDAILNPDDLIRIYGIFGAEKVPESGRINVEASSLAKGRSRISRSFRFKNKTSGILLIFTPIYKKCQLSVSGITPKPTSVHNSGYKISEFS